ncbi:MAG: 2OG-Fe(II) oxygenase [Planctomycetota bacterium]
MSAYAIFDDVLDEEEWTRLWSWLQVCELNPVTRTAGAWKLDDGVPLGGEEIVTPPRDAELAEPGAEPGTFPSGTPLDAVLAAVLGVAGEAEHLVGTDFARVTARAYVYPRGSALSWHSDDSAAYTGAFIYYAHPYWNAHWGGELLLADGAVDAGVMGHRFDDHAFSEALLESGTGAFVAPKPNRLVLLGDAPHMVTPVRDAAGSAVRATVSGFFLREDPT